MLFYSPQCGWLLKPLQAVVRRARVPRLPGRAVNRARQLHLRARRLRLPRKRESATGQAQQNQAPQNQSPQNQNTPGATPNSTAPNGSNPNGTNPNTTAPNGATPCVGSPNGVAPNTTSPSGQSPTARRMGLRTRIRAQARARRQRRLTRVPLQIRLAPSSIRERHPRGDDLEINSAGYCGLRRARFFLLQTERGEREREWDSRPPLETFSFQTMLAFANCVTASITHFVSFEVSNLIETPSWLGLVAAVWPWAVVAVLGMETVIYVTAETFTAMKPRADPNERAAGEPLRTIVSVGCAVSATS